MTIGNNIQRARVKKGLNQKQLCKLAGITEASLSRYENDLREPKIDTLKKLSKALEVSINYLIDESDAEVVESKKSGLSVTLKVEGIERFSKFVKDVSNAVNYGEDDLKRSALDCVDSVRFAIDELRGEE